jgi:hypothetical protein
MSQEHEQRAHEIVGFLAGELIKGWKAFLVAEQIEISKTNKTSKISDELSKIIQESCLETSVLSLAKITDKYDTRKEAICIKSLFGYAEANPSAFPLLQKEKFPNKIITKYRKQYLQIEPIFKKIGNQRDQLLAHLDNKLLRNAYLHRDNPITPDEIRNAFGFLHTIIYAFANYLKNKTGIPMYDKNLNHKIADDFSVMLLKAPPTD